MKPQPLDLEKIESIILDEQLGDLKFDDMMKKLKQQIKLACEFYLMYKDKSDLLKVEHKIKVPEDFSLEGNPTHLLDGYVNSIRKRKYNEWLFKLAFKEVLG